MKILNRFTSFNADRYFEIRDIVMGRKGNYPKLIRKLLWIWVMRTNKKYNSNIYTSCRGGNVFVCSLPTSWSVWDFYRIDCCCWT